MDPAPDLVTIYEAPGSKTVQLQNYGFEKKPKNCLNSPEMAFLFIFLVREKNYFFEKTLKTV